MHAEVLEQDDCRPAWPGMKARTLRSGARLDHCGRARTFDHGSDAGAHRDPRGRPVSRETTRGPRPAGALDTCPQAGTRGACAYALARGARTLAVVRGTHAGGGAGTCAGEPRCRACRRVYGSQHGSGSVSRETSWCWEPAGRRRCGCHCARVFHVKQPKVSAVHNQAWGRHVLLVSPPRQVGLLRTGACLFRAPRPVLVPARSGCGGCPARRPPLMLRWRSGSLRIWVRDSGPGGERGGLTQMPQGWVPVSVSMFGPIAARCGAGPDSNLDDHEAMGVISVRRALGAQRPPWLGPLH